MGATGLVDFMVTIVLCVGVHVIMILHGDEIFGSHRRYSTRQPGVHLLPTSHCVYLEVKRPWMEIICLQTEAFYELVNEVVTALKEKHGIEHDKWIDGEEAMSMLRIKSKTTLQKLRDEGKIRFSQPQKKLLLYDRDSILDYLETHAKDPF